MQIAGLRLEQRVGASRRRRVIPRARATKRAEVVGVGIKKRGSEPPRFVGGTGGWVLISEWPMIGIRAAAVAFKSASTPRAERRRIRLQS